MHRITIVLCAAAMLGGCATNPSPVATERGLI
jgi:hypothetical protein